MRQQSGSDISFSINATCRPALGAALARWNPNTRLTQLEHATTPSNYSETQIAVVRTLVAGVAHAARIHGRGDRRRMWWCCLGAEPTDLSEDLSSGASICLDRYYLRCGATGVSGAGSRFSLLFQASEVAQQATFRDSVPCEQAIDLPFHVQNRT